MPDDNAGQEFYVQNDVIGANFYAIAFLLRKQEKYLPMSDKNEYNR
ncbi:MAG: hypothetical protein ACI3U2_03160 [Anaerovibrio sp.]